MLGNWLRGIWKKKTEAIITEEKEGKQSGEKTEPPRLIPTHLDGFVKEYAIRKHHFRRMTICSSSGTDQLELWYVGEVKEGKEPWIIGTENQPVRIMAKDPVSGEEILIFDGARHGYEAMFCEADFRETDQVVCWKKYELPPVKLVLELMYSAAWDEEQSGFDFDEDGKCILADGTKMEWDDVKRNGFDGLVLMYENPKGKLVELAVSEELH
ncbi:MAG: hypothetical protein IJ468_05075 [Lachnospiraceae bacterium]|nr:hypothetical protein [Lachnospiraceae bacterium]